jgi:four helix bundle protein
VATLNKVEELMAWRKARQLCGLVPKLTLKDSLRTDFAYRDQIWRSAISIMSNIAEGFGRTGAKDFHHFLLISRGSAAEVQSLLYVGSDANYLDEMEFKAFYSLAEEVIMLIGGLQTYLKKRQSKTKT